MTSYVVSGRTTPLCHGFECMYQYVDADGQPLYYGMTRQLAWRTAQHRALSAWWPDARIQIATRYASRLDARTAEAQAIEQDRPLYNIKGGKTYVEVPRPKPIGKRIIRHVDDLFIVQPGRFVTRGGKFEPWSTPA